MTMVFDENIPATKLLIDVILNRDIEVITTKAQWDIQSSTPEGHNIRLDIYAKEPIKVLFDAVDSWRDCLGFIVNPWGQKNYLDKNTIHMLREYNKCAFIDIVKGSVEDLHVASVVKIKEECDDSYTNENVDDIIYVDEPCYDEDEEDIEERMAVYEIEL